MGQCRVGPCLLHYSAFLGKLSGPIGRKVGTQGVHLIVLVNIGLKTYFSSVFIVLLKKGNNLRNLFGVKLLTLNSCPFIKGDYLTMECNIIFVEGCNHKLQV